MPKHFLIIFIVLVVGFSAEAHAQCKVTQASTSYLMDRGFSTDIASFGLRRLLFPHTVMSELEFMIKKGRRVNFNYFHMWIEGNILYEIRLASREYANGVVLAFILEEGSYERWRAVPPAPASIKYIPDEPRFGKHTGMTYAVETVFFRVNINDEPPTAFIGIDIDGDGIIQEGEGRYIWF